MELRECNVREVVTENALVAEQIAHRFLAGEHFVTAPSFASLLQAYLNCTRTKHNKASVLAFDMHLERNLCDLYDQLMDGSYRPGRSICFPITHPKPREVWAASIRDRIVHWLAVIEGDDSIPF